MAFRVLSVQLYHDEIARMAGIPKVRAELTRVAEQIAANGRSLAGSGETADSIFVESGTRPKGRPFSRAVSDPRRFGGTVPGKYERRVMLCQAADISH